MNCVKVGIVGLGNFGRLHAETALSLNETELVAVVDTQVETLKQLPDPIAAIPQWTDLSSAIEESDAEAWIVATSTASHVPLTSLLLEAGKSVLLEKPISEDLSSAESLARKLEQSKGQLMLGHVALFNSEFLHLQTEVENRGSLQFIDCVRHRPSSTMDAFPGESPFHLTMVHDLYLVLALKNREEPVKFTTQAHSNENGDCDLALAQLQWADGSIASLTASFKTPAGMGSDGFDRIEVFGENWNARIHPNPRPIEVWDDAKAHWPSALEIGISKSGAASGMLAEQVRTFCRVIRDQQAIPLGASYEDGLQVQRWLDTLSNQASNSFQDSE